MLLFFFFNDPATTEIYTLSLHDALPISQQGTTTRSATAPSAARVGLVTDIGQLNDRGFNHLAYVGVKRAQSQLGVKGGVRSEEHTSELQSQSNLVCRLLLEKKESARRDA